MKKRNFAKKVGLDFNEIKDLLSEASLSTLLANEENKSIIGGNQDSICGQDSLCGTTLDSLLCIPPPQPQDMQGCDKPIPLTNNCGS